MKPEVILIAAVYSDKKGIGFENRLPWPRHAEDMAEFKRQTVGHPVIMGRRTWDSLPHALVDRTNIVVSGSCNLNLPSGVISCDSIYKAVSTAARYGDRIFVIGGESIYKQALLYATDIILSRIPPVDSATHIEPIFDTYFPEFENQHFEKVDTHKKAKAIEGFLEPLTIEYWESTV